MSPYEIPIFDLLRNIEEPFCGFGKPVVYGANVPGPYLRTAETAFERVSELAAFDDFVAVSTIEKLISAMWNEGWNPLVGDVNLFATDFGLVVTESLRHALSGNLVTRSDDDLSHASLWWPKARVEAFPIQAVYKRLIQPEGSTLDYFAHSVTLLVK